MKLRLHLFFLLLTFTFAASAQKITSIGIIGSAAPYGWDKDTNLVIVPTDTNAFVFKKLKLIDGAVKFRANDAWTINWGAKEFPKGVGTQGGPDIPVLDGTYDISFNKKTGEYFFDVISNVSIIGDATPGGWDADTKMYRVKGDTNKYKITIDLKKGGLKFRLNKSWDVNWGDLAFPNGTGTQGGKDIPVPAASTYDITFDKKTGAYTFAENVAYSVIGIIGDATPGGWDKDSLLTKDGTNPDLWKGKMKLKVGAFKFRANKKWDVAWGGTAFPKGKADPKGGDIPVKEAGTYLISFNTKTLDYEFKIIKPYPRIGIIGDATEGNWTAETQMTRVIPGDSTDWFLRTKLKVGEMKFRANNAWDVDWGGSDFPKGIGEQGGPNIPIKKAGDYKIYLNTVTGEYNFEEVIEFGKISLVGRSGPFGDWPATGDNGAKDTYLIKSATNGNLWTHPGVTLSDFSAATDGGIKFRAETAWTINWGAKNFPKGIGTQNGPNIECKPGTYKISFRSDTGEYGFSDPSVDAVDILDQNALNVYPNPTAALINIDINNEKLNGNTSVKIYDALGKMIYNQSHDRTHIRIDASSFANGNYFIQLSNEKFLVGKQISVIR
jgi:hypothetical protein